jgi:hypothetical protein
VQVSQYLYNPNSLLIGDDFKDNLESAVGCQLSDAVKSRICDLIMKYCFHGGLAVNLDLQAVQSLPDEFKVTFCKLLQHAYSIDSRVMELVLKITKIYADYSNDAPDSTPDDNVEAEEEVLATTPANTGI